MRLQVTLATLAIVATHATAFKDTAPLLISSTTPNVALTEAASEITSGVIAAEEVYGVLETLGCDWDALVVVDLDDLHHSQTSTLSFPSPHQPSLNVPYLIRPSTGSLRSSVHAWAASCGAEVSLSLSDADGSEKQAFWLKEMPSTLDTLGSNQLLIVTGSPSGFEVDSPQQVMAGHGDELKKRQFDSFEEIVQEVTEDLYDDELSNPFDESEAVIVEVAKNSSRPSANDTLPSPDAPLLERVQLLSTPVIMSLLISFGILIPILMFGISALVGIQVPPRMMEINKAMNVGQQKKDQ